MVTRVRSPTGAEETSVELYPLAPLRSTSRLCRDGEGDRAAVDEAQSERRDHDPFGSLPSIVELVLSTTSAPFNVTVMSPRPRPQAREEEVLGVVQVLEWVDRRAVRLVQLEVEMRLDPVRVAGVADEADQLAAR